MVFHGNSESLDENLEVSRLNKGEICGLATRKIGI